LRAAVRSPRVDERRRGAGDPATGGAQLLPGGRHAGCRPEGRGPGGAAAMSILVDGESRVVVQGITGREGTFHARQCRDYGTKIVAGVTPGRGGAPHEGVPVYDPMREAVERERAGVSQLF